MKTNLFIRIALCAMLVLALCTVAFAAGDLTVSVGEDAECAGGTVTVPVSVSGNAAGFGGMEFSVSFDNVNLTLTEVNTDGAFAAFTITPIDVANSEGRVDFVFVNLTPENVTGDGKIATLTFEISEGATPMITPLIVYVPSGIAFRYENNAMVDLGITAVDGAVTVNKTPVEMLCDLGIRLPDYSGDTSKEITKLQLALMLAQIVSGDVGLDAWEKDSASGIYTDVNEYGKAVDYLRERRFISGKTASTFGANDSIKYQDLLVLAVRMLGYESADMQYPYGYILAANRLELTYGITAEYTSAITVADACKVVWNMFNTEYAILDPISEQIVYPGEDCLWEQTTGNMVKRSTFAEVYFYHTHKCTFGDWIVSIPATPASYGEQYRICMVCGEKETEILPILDMPDVNGDGKITVIDIMLVLDAAVNKTPLPSGDVNGDGKITLTDVIKVVVLASK